MTILKFRSRRQRDAGERIIPVGMPGYQVPVRFRPDPAPGEKMWEPLTAPAADPRFADPHGIATPETLADLMRQAQEAAEAIRQEEAERERLRPPGTFADSRAGNTPLGGNAPWGAWDEPGSFPEPLRAVPDENGRVYGWDITAMDVPPRHARPYAARRRSPDIAADLASLPVFREAVARRTRSHAGECLCGSPVKGQAWGERMVRAGMHLTGNEAAA
jgi:hypothetical protein